jgi:hypothetical protein
LDTPKNRERAPHYVPLAIHLTSRPHAGNPKTPKPQNPVNLKKLFIIIIKFNQLS